MCKRNLFAGKGVENVNRKISKQRCTIHMIVGIYRR